MLNEIEWNINKFQICLKHLANYNFTNNKQKIFGIEPQIWYYNN